MKKINRITIFALTILLLIPLSLSLHAENTETEIDNSWFYTDFGLPEEYQRENWETRKTLYEKTCLHKAASIPKNYEQLIEFLPFEEPNHKKRVEQFKSEDPLILIVKPTSNAVQYTCPHWAPTRTGITLTQVTIVKILKNKTEEQLAEGQTVWIKESYSWYTDENGTEVFESPHGARCKPLYANDEYLISAERFKEATKELVFSFDEQYYWDATTPDKKSGTTSGYPLYESRWLYCAFWEIDAYREDVFEHFGIIEKDYSVIFSAALLATATVLFVALTVFVVKKHQKKHALPSPAPDSETAPESAPEAETAPESAPEAETAPESAPEAESAPDPESQPPQA